MSDAFLQSRAVKEFREEYLKDQEKQQVMLGYIHNDQLQLIEWAKAYENGESLVSDLVYDSIVSMMQNSRRMLPELWDALDHPAYRDSAWTYTGSFYHGLEEESTWGELKEQDEAAFHISENESPTEIEHKPDGSLTSFL